MGISPLPLIKIRGGKAKTSTAWAGLQSVVGKWDHVSWKSQMNHPGWQCHQMPMEAMRLQNFA